MVLNVDLVDPPFTFSILDDQPELAGTNGTLRLHTFNMPSMMPQECRSEL